MIALLEYQKANTFDKMILISPSANEDPKYDRIDWTERYENYSGDIIKDIVEAQKEDIEESIANNIPMKRVGEAEKDVTGCYRDQQQCRRWRRR